MYIETERCIIRNFNLTDAEDLYETLSDEEVMQYIESPFTLEQTQGFIQNAGLSDKPLVYALLAKDTKKGIGHVIYHPYEENCYEIGWMINRKFWRMGIANEITRALIEISREKKLSGLVIECVPEQSVSRHIALKNHFTYEGIREGLEIYRLIL